MMELLLHTPVILLLSCVHEIAMYHDRLPTISRFEVKTAFVRVDHKLSPGSGHGCPVQVNRLLDNSVSLGLSGMNELGLIVLRYGKVCYIYTDLETLADHITTLYWPGTAFTGTQSEIWDMVNCLALYS